MKNEVAVYYYSQQNPYSTTAFIIADKGSRDACRDQFIHINDIRPHWCATEVKSTRRWIWYDNGSKIVFVKQAHDLQGLSLSLAFSCSITVDASREFLTYPKLFIYEI